MQQQQAQAINRLFRDYRRTFESGDAEQVAEFYRFPMHYYGSSGAKATIDREEFVRLVERVLGFYRRLGVTQIVGTVADTTGLNDSLARVSLNWVLLRNEEGETAEVYSATTRYLVSDFEGALKIDGLIAVNESRRIRQALHRR